MSEHCKIYCKPFSLNKNYFDSYSAINQSIAYFEPFLLNPCALTIEHFR